jgi:serine/threonine protein kinase
VLEDDDVETLSALTNPQLRLSAGEWLRDRFQLTTRLGEGLFGTTWRALDTTGGADVAVKVMGSLLLLNEGERRDFHGKCEMFTRRTLAGCVLPSDVVLAPGCVAVVSPMVDGVSLRAVLSARRAAGSALSTEEALRVVHSLVLALQAMHTASPHGLLRPENVLVTAKGLLLTDGILGVCIPPDRLVERVRAAQSEAMPYLAPEVLAGRRPTASADLYALGAMTTEVIGGATPDRGPDLSSFTPELRRAVATLLDREPGRRPAGSRMLLDALSAMAGLPQRPADPRLPLPEHVALRTPGNPPAPAPSTSSSSSTSTSSPSSRLPTVAPVSEPPPDVAQGRLGSATASIPLLVNPRLPVPITASGPPPDLAVRSGPPGGLTLPPLRNAPVAPVNTRLLPPLHAQRAPMPEPEAETVMRPAPQRPAPPPSAPSRSLREDDLIDPKLLRAAKMLDAERRVPRPETLEEIDLLDDD